jgi:hypothetical protein
MSALPPPDSTLPPLGQLDFPGYLTVPTALLPMLRARLGQSVTKGRVIQGCRVQMLKERLGSRQVMAYKVALLDPRTNTRSQLELIGKSVSGPAGARAAQEFQAMRTVWEAGFGTDKRFRIARPIDHCPDLGLLLEEKAPGVAFSNFVGQSSPSSLSYGRMAGLWLAKLHKVKTSGLNCSYQADLEALNIFVKELSAALPSLSHVLQTLDKAIRKKFESFRGVSAAMVHGDFHPENILVARGRVTVIDFDRFCISDPAKDVGSFIAHMRIKAGISRHSLEMANREIATFLNAYFGAVSKAERTILAPRIPAFVGHSCLEALYYVVCVMRVTDADLHAIYLRCALGSGVLQADPVRTVAVAAD